jgi:hypothetical protein
MSISKLDKKNTAQLLKNAEKMYELALKHGETRKAKITLNAFQELHDRNNAGYIYALQKLRRMPVTIEEFMDSPEFLAEQLEIWPKLRQSVIECNPDILAGEKKPEEILYLGASGTGKSVRAMVTNLYQLYLVDCFDWPQELYSMSRPTELVFMFLSIKPTTAEKVLYKPFRQYFLNMPYAQKHIEYNKDIESELILNQNKVVRAAAANVNSLVAHAIMSGIIDEVNFYARVKNSQQTPDGSIFDQAEIVEKTMLNRRNSRFKFTGPNPGVICISAQTRYKGDFTDRRVYEIKKNNETKDNRVIYYREGRPDVWPDEKLAKETFKILVGTDEYPTRIMDEQGKNYSLPPNAVLMDIPKNFEDEFKRDPEYALREICGISTSAITPFIAQRQKIYEAVIPWTERNLLPWTTEQNYKLNEYALLNEKGMPRVIEDNLPRDGKPRFVHVDLSVVQDRCGIAICHIDGYREVGNEKLPYYVVDWVVTLEPDSVNQVDVSEVRRWVSDLRLKYGLNIARVSYDGFQSIETIQQLRKLGINAINISVDKTLEPYENIKSAFYSNQIAIPDNDLLKSELAALELNLNANGGKGKVDHTPIIGKDSADACTGAVYNASLSGDVKVNAGYSYRTSARPTVGQRPRSRHGATI